MAELEVRDLTVEFASGGYMVRPLDKLSFDADDGELVVVLGPSGCGKTTLLSCLAGLLTPTSGSITFRGTDIAGLAGPALGEHRRSTVGVVFQAFNLIPSLSARGNVMAPMRLARVPRREAAARADELLAQVGLVDRADHRPGQMSGGQQQRVALARALATQPKVVLLDEPLSALDAKLRQELRGELKQVLASVRATTIVVTHDQEEAMSLAERIIVMNHGAIAQQGTPDEIYSRPNSRFVAEFMGRSNWFSGRITGQSGADGLGFATASGIALRIPAPAQPHPGEVDVCIRPERIDLAWGSEAAGRAAAAPNVNQVAGRVAGAALLGPDRQFLIELAGGDRIVASLPNRLGSVPAEGEPVLVRFSAEDCIVVPTSG